jgi:uncharacterized protein YggT (Ycf19 family)
MKLYSALPTNDLIDPVQQILILLRFLCFMAVVYLALHKIAARLSRKPDSKVIWFFSVVTAPLTQPVRRCLAPGTTESSIISAALLFYFALWLIFILIERWRLAAPS